MRSQLVFDAMSLVPNRFLLAKLAARATRQFHRPHTRIEDTANHVLRRFGMADPMHGSKLNKRQDDRLLQAEI